MRMCPKCGSSNVATERRPNGNSNCKNCGFSDKTANFNYDDLKKAQNLLKETTPTRMVLDKLQKERNAMLEFIAESCPFRCYYEGKHPSCKSLECEFLEDLLKHDN